MADGEASKSEAPEPSDEEVAAYLAESCADLARLCERPGFKTIRYLLGLVKMESEKLKNRKGVSFR